MLRETFAVWAAVGLASLACAGVGYQSRALHDSVMGVSGSDLRSCLGQPGQVLVADASEIWIYQRHLSGGYNEVTVQLAEGAGTAHKRPDVLEGSPSRTTEGDPRRLVPEPGSVPPGRCRLAFQVHEGRIAAIDTTGRTHENLNADAQCAFLLKPCADEAGP